MHGLRWMIAASAIGLPAAASAADWHYADMVVGAAPNRAITLIDKASVTAEAGTKRRFRTAQLLETPNGGIAWLVAESSIDCSALMAQTLSAEAFGDDGVLRDRKATPNPAYKITPNSSTDYFRAGVCGGDWSRVVAIGPLALSDIRKRLFAALAASGS